MNSANDWAFPDPKNTAVIANKKIIHGDVWISFVTRDADDGTWQFHCHHEGELTDEDASVVSLGNILAIDPSIASLADLPVGWSAWRTSKEGAWRRKELSD
jgi:hypothetical protein